MKILVTGGAGFIGSWTTKLLLDAGHEVTVVDNLSRGHQESIDSRAIFYQIDLSDQYRMEGILAGHDTVIHMAALIEVGESVKDPVSFAENNIVNSVKLLEAMRKTEVRKIIFSSSACVYGVPSKLPIMEDDPLGAQSNPYGITKLTMEQFCTLYHNLYSFDCTILRYFNPYGPGELHQPETHAIPNFIKSALAKEPIPLYWKGEGIRDFIYIEDLALAHVAVINLTGLHIFNVGTEKGIKVMDIINKISDILGYKVEVNDLGERAGDVMANYASFAKIKKEVSWEPKVSLEEGLKRTIEFFRQKV
ncbi:UDP-glucose 4-epimerase GalE [Candidatus Microgenomates bacterium]|nr:UDP-glucose 4-epimerase GalE [Candidatus Microgenomates bacterium]